MSNIMSHTGESASLGNFPPASKSQHPLRRLTSSIHNLQERHRDRHRPTGFGFVFADPLDENMSVWLRHRVPALNWVLRGLLGGIPHAEAPERNPFKSTMNVADGIQAL